MIEQFVLEAPVLMVAFNRPDTTQNVFQKIREARPQKLYVAVDGPRSNKEGEEQLVEEVKEIVKAVDWPCQTQYRFNETNKGAEVTVSSAISWVLENEEYVIIIEDDIIAPLSFFKFAQEMLKKYKHEERIATVTGSNFTPIPVSGNIDYFFAKYGHSWGWATWKRAWEGFDLNVEIPEKHLSLSFLKTITTSKTEAKYYKKLFSRLQKNGAGDNTWDYIGLYRHRINDSLSIIPRVNLTSNIGIYGLHARGKTEHHFRAVDEEFKVQNHPDRIECFENYDKHHFKTYINKKKLLHKRIANRLFRLLKLK